MTTELQYFAPNHLDYEKTAHLQVTYIFSEPIYANSLSEKQIVYSQYNIKLQKI